MCDCCGGHGGHGHDHGKPVLIKPVSIKLVQPQAEDEEKQAKE